MLVTDTDKMMPWWLLTSSRESQTMNGGREGARMLGWIDKRKNGREGGRTNN